MQTKSHRPPHVYLDNSQYFITGSIYQKKTLINTDEKLHFILSNLLDTTKIYNIILQAWIILNNHYHILIHTLNGKDLHKFIKRYHSNTAIHLNKIDLTPKRKVWYQYWDRCIRSEKDYYTRLNYIHHNCIKHGYTDKMEGYRFSSYDTYLAKYGHTWIEDCFSIYPIIDFTPEFNDDF